MKRIFQRVGISLFGAGWFIGVPMALAFVGTNGCSDDSQITLSSDVHNHSDECCVKITPQETVYVEIVIPCKKHGHGGNSFVPNDENPFNAPAVGTK